MTPESNEKYIIRNQDELKTHLDLGFDVFIPNFDKEIELTRNELDELKEKIKKSRENKEKIASIFKDTITRYKREKKESIEQTVSDTAWVRVDRLKQEMPTKFRDDPWNRAKENKLDAWLKLWWTLLVWYVGYRLFSWIFWWNKVQKDESKESAKDWFIDLALEKIWLKWEFAKWAKSLWIFWVVLAALGWAYIWMDKVSEYFDRIRNAIWIESKEEKEANEKFAKKIFESENKTVNPLTLKKIKWDKVLDLISWTWFFWNILWLIKNAFIPDSLMPLLKDRWISSIDELKEISYVMDYLKKKKEKGELKVWANTTIWDVIKMDSWIEKLQKQVKDPDLKIAWVWATAWVVDREWTTSPETSEWQDWTWEKPDHASIEEAKKWPWMAFLLWNESTGEDRTLASRILEYAWKSIFFERLYNNYLKFNSIDIGWTKLEKMKKIYSKNDTFWYTWSLSKMIKVEERWWIQWLLSSLQETRNPAKIRTIKKEIDTYLREVQKFEKSFALHVRESKVKPSVLRDNVDEVREFDRLKQEEIKIWNEIHETSKKFDDEIIELRKTETDPKTLATKEAEIRKRYSEALHWPNWKMAELRNTQKEMMSNLESIASWDSVKAKDFLKANKDRLKKSSLPWWKVWLALLWLTAWSMALTWFQDKEKLAYIWAEAVWWFVPFLNVWLDFRQMVTWNDFAWDKLAWWERWWLAPAFLVLDTIWSLAVVSWIWSVAWVPILAWSWALKSMRWVKWWVKIAREAKEAEKIAKSAHIAQWIVEETKILEELSKLWINFMWKTWDLLKIPWDFLTKYREWMKAAYSNPLLKMASPLATTSKIAVYGWIWYSVYTWVWPVGTVIVDKVKSWIDIAKDILL